MRTRILVAHAAVCPCESDCDWEGPGTCAPSSGACGEGELLCPCDVDCISVPGTCVSEEL